MPDLAGTHIVFANNYAGPGVGGGEIQLLYLVRACIDAGMRVTVVTQRGAALTQKVRDLGLKIGTTTGYTHEIMDEIAPVAARAGFMPDCLVCTGDAPDGRPTPFLIYRALLELAVWPAWACIKVDDTEVGVAAGLNAGCWTVGVAVTGNVFGLSLADTNALSPADFTDRRAAAAAKLAGAGAHYVIDGVADLMPVLFEIEGRLARGERP